MKRTTRTNRADRADRTAVTRLLAAPLGLLTLLALAGCGTSARAGADAVGALAAPSTAGTGSATTPSASPSPAPGSSPISGPASTPGAGASPSPASTPGAGASPSPAGPSGSPAAGKPLAGRTIVLDPGHNPGNVDHTTEINRQVDVGNAHKECDTTGTETDAGYTEAEYTLDVVHRLRGLLQGLGATVLLTQDGDRPFGPCVDERAAIGNTAHADAAISVHGDGGPASGSGFHVIMPAKVVAGKADNSAIVDPSHQLGLAIRDSFHAATGEPYADYVADQGLDTRSDLGGLNLSTVPKVFIECGNMRNAGDAGKMTDPQWRQRAAQGLADGFTRFLRPAG